MNRINTRISLILIPLLLAGSLFSAFLLGNFLVRYVRELYYTSRGNEAQTIEYALEHAFVENEFDTVQEIVTDLSYQEQIRVIRVLNTQGEILASSIPLEIGVHINQDSPVCAPCHIGQESMSFTHETEPVTSTIGETTITANPLDNQIACQGCHSTAGATLGVILVENNPPQVNAWVTYINFVVYTGAILLFLVFMGVFWLSFRPLVSSPLHSLTLGDKRSSRTANRKDEIGSIARDLIELETNVQTNTRPLNTQRRRFNALITLTEWIDVTLTVDKVLQLVLEKVQEVTEYTAIAMRTFDSNQNSFCLVAHAGMTARMVNESKCLPANVGFFADICSTRRAAYTQQLAQDKRLAKSSATRGRESVA